MPSVFVFYQKMADIKEQWVYIRCWCNLGTIVAKSYEMLELASGEQVTTRAQAFDYFSKFRSGVMLDHSAGHSGPSSTIKMDENMNQGIGS
jgi:hypothetical protein